MYAQGEGTAVPADPFMSMSLMPAVSSHFRDMTSIRFEHPEFIPENCTGCGDCYTVCPDTAIPGLVNEVGQVLDTVVKRLKKRGGKTEHPLFAADNTLMYFADGKKALIDLTAAIARD